LLTNKKVVKLISNFLGESNNFSQLKIPLRIIAMDLETGKDVVFERGSLRNALQAAMAMPGVFPPVQIDGKTFVDGSTVNPVPVSHLIDMYADIVVGVNALPPLKQLPPSGPTYTNRNGEEPGIDLRSISHSTENWKMVDIIMRSFQKLQHEVSLSKANLADLTITPEVTHFNWKDFTKFSDIIDAGRRATEQTIPKLLEILDKRKLYRRS
jgi:NTE family protein